MNNVMNFTVQGNRLKLLDGFSPAVGDRRYTQIKVQFQGDDWDSCEAVSGHFFASAKEIMRTLPSLRENDTAFFEIPIGLKAGQIHFAVSGSYGEGDELVTIATNIVTIDIKKGVIALDEIDINQYEELLGVFNAGLSLKADKSSVYTKGELDGMFAEKDEDIRGINTELATKAYKATTLEGYGITDAFTKEQANERFQKTAFKTQNIDRQGVSKNEAYPSVQAVIDFVDAENEEKADKTDIPTKTSDLTNDSGYLTSQDISGKADKATTLAGYGILDAFTKAEVNNKLSSKANAEDIPTKTSDLENDKLFIPVVIVNSLDDCVKNNVLYYIGRYSFYIFNAGITQFKFTNSATIETRIFLNGTWGEFYPVEDTYNKAKSISDSNKTSETEYPTIKAITEYIALCGFLTKQEAYDKRGMEQKAERIAEQCIEKIEYRDPNEEEYGGWLVYDDGANFVIPLANLGDEFYGFSGDYNDLANKPCINGKTIEGALTSGDLGINIPTKTSELTNDSGFLTSQDISGKADKATTLAGYGITDTYTKAQLDAKLNNKLNKGDFAQYKSTVYTKAEIDNKGYLTSHQSLAAYYTSAQVDAAIQTAIGGVENGSY